MENTLFVLVWKQRRIVTFILDKRQHMLKRFQLTLKHAHERLYRRKHHTDSSYCCHYEISASLSWSYIQLALRHPTSILPLLSQSHFRAVIGPWQKHQPPIELALQEPSFFYKLACIFIGVANPAGGMIRVNGKWTCTCTVLFQSCNHLKLIIH